MSQKIAIASEDGERIAAHFGRTPYFAVLTVEDNRITDRELRPNAFTLHMQGGHGDAPGGNPRGMGGGHGGGCGPDRIIAGLSDCQTVICGGAGRRIQEAMRGAGIEMIVTDRDLVEDAADAWLRGELAHTGGFCEGRDHH